VAKYGSDLFKRFGELRVLLGVLRGKMCDAARGPGVIIVKKYRTAVGGGRENAWVRPEDFAAEFVELHVERDVCAERAKSVCERRRMEARMKLLGDCAAADKFAALENNGFETALS
jgi:hypothetical protein